MAAKLNPDSVGIIETEEMKMAEQVSKEEVARAVDALGAIVEKSGLNKAQIISHLSPYDSGGEQGWANTPKSAVKPGDVGHTVDGTDYVGVKKEIAMKAQSGAKLTKAEALILADVNPLRAIAAKVAKSEALTPAEVWAISGGVAKAMKDGYMDKADDEAEEAEKAVPMPMHAAKADEEEEKEEEAEKGVAKSILAALRASARAASPSDDLRKALEDERKVNADFRVEVAKSLALIGQLVSGQVERAAEPTPVRGPKSAQRAAEAPMASQGFGAFGAEQINKGGISRAIRKALEAGDPNVTETDLLAWEADLSIRPDLKSYLQRAAR